MEFRWVAAIALWTILSGPIFNGRGSLSAPPRERLSAQVAKPAATNPQAKAQARVTFRVR
jgi:hypothetical protein